MPWMPARMAVWRTGPFLLCSSPCSICEMRSAPRMTRQVAVAVRVVSALAETSTMRGWWESERWVSSAMGECWHFVMDGQGEMERLVLWGFWLEPFF